jgi:predicted enzyme related to lactoylglutathione lyase
METAMPTRTTAPVGAPCWIELTTSDSDRSRAFYSQVFGWTAEEPNAEFGGYFNFVKDGVPIAGAMASQPGGGLSDVWSIYLNSPDADATTRLASEHGGAVHVPVMEVADIGRMAFVGDVGGAAIGVWQPGTFNGFGVFGDPNTPAWFELQTRNWRAALEFYRDVFHWTIVEQSDTPEFRYAMLVSGDAQLAGVMDASAFLPDGVPAYWSVYFGVDDADATLDKIARLGGQIVEAAEDTPYGRLATAADPTGARFKLVAPNEMMPARDSSQTATTQVTA